MGKFDQYNIPLKGLKSDSETYEFTLDDDFFKKIDSPEVQRGNVSATLTVKKKNSLFELSFALNGVILIPCNRCLDYMEQRVQYKEKIQVQLGTDYSEMDDIVIIPESEGSINIAWFLYEFIVVSIPIKHAHAPGECNKTMMTKMKKHIIRKKNDEDDESDNISFDDDDDLNEIETSTDPRWDGLQNIFENN